MIENLSNASVASEQFLVILFIKIHNRPSQIISTSPSFIEKSLKKI